ncbi:rhodanese-like domain-containing protein [Micrococcales bacterium 31B]|nr:rhodanese-like domain-containing protein [Micrococcales bacterium 31B]
MSYAGDISVQEAWDKVSNGAILVDVRTAAECNFVGVPDLAELGREAAFLEWNQLGTGKNPNFETQLREVVEANPGSEFVFLCRSGQRSQGAATAATALGATAFNIVDGFEGQLDTNAHRGVGGWKTAGLPWKQS